MTSATLESSRLRFAGMASGGRQKPFRRRFNSSHLNLAFKSSVNNSVFLNLRVEYSKADSKTEIQAQLQLLTRHLTLVCTTVAGFQPLQCLHIPCWPGLPLLLLQQQLSMCLAHSTVALNSVLRSFSILCWCALRFGSS